MLPALGFSQDIILNGSVKVEGGLEINSPQQSNQAVTKEYVDNLGWLFISLSIATSANDIVKVFNKN